MDRTDVIALWSRTLPRNQVWDTLSPEESYGAGERVLSVSALPELPTAPAPTADPRQLNASGSFELRGEIGRGGEGVINRAWQPSLAREVAIKRLTGRVDAPVRAKFIAEVLVTSALEHPNIVPVHELGRDHRGEPFLAMRLVGGTTWKRVLHPTTPEDQARALRFDRDAHVQILLAVCNAVAFAHSRGIAHCDLKPANVMVGEFGEVLVVDWGMAVDIDDAPGRGKPAAHRSSIDRPAGTPAYMPPELALGRGLDIGPWTDVFLLGGILHELVTGFPPYRGATVIEVATAACACLPPQFGPEVPPGVQAIIRRALARDRNERYPTVAAFQEALRTYQQSQQSEVLTVAAEAALARAQRHAQVVMRHAAASGRIALGSRRVADAVVERQLYADYTEALAGFRQAQALRPDNHVAVFGERRARLALAETALDAGDLALAAVQAEQLPPSDPAASVLRNRLAELRRGRERAHRAAQRLRRVLVGSGALLIAALGLALVIGANTAPTIDAAQALAELADTHHDLAVLLERQGDHAGAAAHYAAAADDWRRLDVLRPGLGHAQRAAADAARAEAERRAALAGAATSTSPSR